MESASQTDEQPATALTIGDARAAAGDLAGALAIHRACAAERTPWATLCQARALDEAGALRRWGDVGTLAPGADDAQVARLGRLALADHLGALAGVVVAAGAIAAVVGGVRRGALPARFAAIVAGSAATAMAAAGLARSWDARLSLPPFLALAVGPPLGALAAAALPKRVRARRAAIAGAVAFAAPLAAARLADVAWLAALLPKLPAGLVRGALVDLPLRW